MNATILLLATALLTQTAAADEQAGKQIEIARSFVLLLQAGDFEKAVGSFDETMRAGLPAEKLKRAWEGVTSQHGSFQRTGDARTQAIPKYQVVLVTTEFARGRLDTKFVFDADSRIAGLFFVPSEQYQSPAYVKSSAFDDEEFAVGKGLLPLAGTLSLPKGAGPFPAVVLVHGSGPHDQDETIGPNKPFRDLAHGLASRGIAVLRYEKRTKQHALVMSLRASGITVKQETVDDAAAAVDGLAHHERIDSRRIFVLGHSLGGTLLPRIALANDRIAGCISLAGSARPLEDLVLEQTNYIWSLDGTMTDEQSRQFEELKQQVAAVKSPDLSPQTPASELPLGIPAKYWLDLRGYDPAEAAKAIETPLLFLQGERDYQVTMDDFARWKLALGSQPRAKFIAYPTLNHLFMEGRGKSSPAEYSERGNVAEFVVADIAAWIGKQVSK